MPTRSFFSLLFFVKISALMTWLKFLSFFNLSETVVNYAPHDPNVNTIDHDPKSSKLFKSPIIGQPGVLAGPSFSNSYNIHILVGLGSSVG